MCLSLKGVIKTARMRPFTIGRSLIYRGRMYATNDRHGMDVQTHPMVYGRKEKMARTKHTREDFQSAAHFCQWICF